MLKMPQNPLTTGKNRMSLACYVTVDAARAVF
jgi:hypothetical protein